ncbi:hypothetical protein D3C74_248710 [compost metagenome]
MPELQRLPDHIFFCVAECLFFEAHRLRQQLERFNVAFAFPPGRDDRLLELNIMMPVRAV